MAPVGAAYHVFLAQIIANADRYRFLANSQMDRAFDYVAGINLSDALLGSANEFEASVEPGRIRRRFLLRGRVGAHALDLTRVKIGKFAFKHTGFFMHHSKKREFVWPG